VLSIALPMTASGPAWVVGGVSRRRRAETTRRTLTRRTTTREGVM
jgi:hypothetical protein